MQLYKYLAKNVTGKTVRGIFEAENLSEFYKKLEQEDLICIEYNEEAITAVRTKTIYKLKAKDLVLFCRKLSTMLAAGTSITSCLDIMCESSDNIKLGRVYINLYEAIKGGKTLSAAMRDSGNSFPPLLINMIESGEESGNVDLICKKLSVYYEKQSKMSSKIKVATAYPKLLGILAFVVIIILFVFVLPSIFKVFSTMELPLITKILMSLSNFLVDYWYFVIIGIIVLIVSFKTLITMREVKVIIDKILVNIPKIGPLLKKIYSARFANTLSILYASGLSLLNCINLSVNVIGNTYIENKLIGVIETVSVGNSLSSAISEINVFDKLLSSMIRIGEETGSLDTILTTVSEYYDQETESSIESLLGILEPVLLIVMAIVMGTVLIAVMYPIFMGYGEIG